MSKKFEDSDFSTDENCKNSEKGDDENFEDSDNISQNEKEISQKK